MGVFAMNRPLTITTQRHPVAAAVYVFMATLGVFYITGVAKAMALTDLMGKPATNLWFSLLTGFALCSVIALLLPARVTTVALLMESTGCIGLFTLNAVYVASLFIEFGFTVVTTQSAFTALAVGFLARGAQAFRERGKVTAALRHPRSADPPPLAEAEPRERQTGD